MIDLVATFITFFAVIDPVGTIPVYLAVCRRVEESHRKRLAVIAVAVAAAILVFFVVAGELILRYLSIPLPAFQLAGGIILFLFALTMIFGPSKPDEELEMVRSGIHEPAIHPLAMPSIASPGAILAAVLLTGSATVSIWEQAQVTLVILAVLVVQLVLLLAATRIHRIIGNAGASVISRVMGMLLAAVATTNVVQGIQGSFLG